MAQTGQMMNQAQAWLCARDLVQSQMGNDEQGRPHSCVLTDFKVRDSGFERVLVIAGAGVSPTRAGRIVQRLLELETYRLMVLRGLPVAKQLAPQLTRMETAWPTMPSAWSTKPPKTNNCWTPWCLWRYGWKKPRPSTCTVLARRGPTRPSCSAAPGFAVRVSRVHQRLAAHAGGPCDRNAEPTVVGETHAGAGYATAPAKHGGRPVDRGDQLLRGEPVVVSCQSPQCRRRADSTRNGRGCGGAVGVVGRGADDAAYSRQNQSPAGLKVQIR